MDPIRNVQSNSPVQKLINNPIQKTISGDAPKTRSMDRLELSGVSHLLTTLKSNDVRADKVTAIKSQIESGTYDADGKKLDAAIEKMLDEVLK
jgi:anti-sigma28 factor (negative regulator of flagellin synthesis)